MENKKVRVYGFIGTIDVVFEGGKIQKVFPVEGGLFVSDKGFFDAGPDDVLYISEAAWEEADETYGASWQTTRDFTDLVCDGQGEPSEAELQLASELFDACEGQDPALLLDHFKEDGAAVLSPEFGWTYNPCSEIERQLLGN